MCRAILILILSALGAQAGLSKLEAISMLETGNNDAAVGSAGEVSRYQIMPRIWRCYSKSHLYQDAQLSAWVANQYLASLEACYQAKTGREPNDFDRYVLWNAGPVYYARIGFSRTKVHPIIRERADRFVNLRQMGEPAKSRSLPSMLAFSAPIAPINLRQALSLPSATPVSGLDSMSFRLPQSGNLARSN